MARNLESNCCLSLLVNLDQFILNDNNMFLLPLKLQCAWHLHLFSFTPVHGLFSNYRSAGVWLIGPQKVENDLCKSPSLSFCEGEIYSAKHSEEQLFCISRFSFCFAIWRHYALTLLEIFHLNVYRYKTSLIKCFSLVFLFNSPITRNPETRSNFNFPWQFELSGFNCNDISKFSSFPKTIGD